MSSGKQQQKQFAVTFFVSENDKTKLVDIIHRAKTVIAKKVDKVMGKKEKVKGQVQGHSAAGSRRSSGSAGQAKAEVGFLSLLPLFYTLFQPNEGKTWSYRASHVLIDWVLWTWISSVPLSARLCLG